MTSKMPRSREEIQQERRQLRNMYGALYDDVAALLFRHDPIGINFDVNTDEYEPEVGTILPRLRSCKSVDDVRRELYTRSSFAGLSCPTQAQRVPIQISPATYGICGSATAWQSMCYRSSQSARY
jgi:hypothetical protein